MKNVPTACSSQKTMRFPSAKHRLHCGRTAKTDILQGSYPESGHVHVCSKWWHFMDDGDKVGSKAVLQTGFAVKEMSSATYLVSMFFWFRGSLS